MSSAITASTFHRSVGSQPRFSSALCHVKRKSATRRAWPVSLPAAIDSRRPRASSRSNSTAVDLRQFLGHCGGVAAPGGAHPRRPVARLSRPRKQRVQAPSPLDVQAFEFPHTGPPVTEPVRIDFLRGRPAPPELQHLQRDGSHAAVAALLSLRGSVAGWIAVFQGLVADGFSQGREPFRSILRAGKVGFHPQNLPATLASDFKQHYLIWHEGRATIRVEAAVTRNTVRVEPLRRLVNLLTNVVVGFGHFSLETGSTELQSAWRRASRSSASCSSDLM